MSIVTINFITLNRYVIVHRDFDQIRWDLSLFDNRLFLNETNNSIIFFSVLKHVHEDNVPPDYGQSMFVSSAVRFLPSSFFPDNEKPFPPNLDTIYESFTFEEGREGKPAVTNIGEYYPGAMEYEVAGFVWWQGHKDQNPAHASRYEQNLVHLIKTLRNDFDAPDAKFVLATIAFGGEALSGNGLKVAEAQLAVSGDRGKYPEFVGNVQAIDARPYWRDKSDSPSGAGYHYNHNAETYMEVGDDLGWAMAELMATAQESP